MSTVVEFDSPVVVFVEFEAVFVEFDTLGDAEGAWVSNVELACLS